MKGAIQIIQMLALLPPPARPTGQREVFSIPREWCQRGPLKTAALRSEMNAPAEHNGPNLNTTRIYARSEHQQKTEDSVAPIQPSSYFISCKFAAFINTFCVFLSVYRVWNTWMTLPGVTPPFGCVFFWGVFAGLWLKHRVCVWLQIYTDWANHYLAKSGHKRLIKDLQTDVTDGVLLAEIIQVVGKETLHTRESHHWILNNLHFVATFCIIIKQQELLVSRAAETLLSDTIM